MICELLFPSAILAVKMNMTTLVVVLEVEIYIYDISNMKLLHVIETSPNPDGTLYPHSSTPKLTPSQRSAPSPPPPTPPTSPTPLPSPHPNHPSHTCSLSLPGQFQL